MLRCYDNRLGILESGQLTGEPSRCLSLLLIVSHGCDTHRTKSTELLNFDVVGSGGL